MLGYEPYSFYPESGMLLKKVTNVERQRLGKPLIPFSLLGGYGFYPDRPNWICSGCRFGRSRVCANDSVLTEKKRENNLNLIKQGFYSSAALVASLFLVHVFMFRIFLCLVDGADAFSFFCGFLIYGFIVWCWSCLKIFWHRTSCGMGSEPLAESLAAQVSGS